MGEAGRVLKWREHEIQSDSFIGAEVKISQRIHGTNVDFYGKLMIW